MEFTGDHRDHMNIQTAMMIKRNTSGQQNAIERFKAVKNNESGEQAIMPKNGFGKGVSFAGSPDETKINSPQSFAEASTAFGNSVLSPSGMILDRRHLRTRGNDKVSSSIDMKCPSNQNWRGIFSSMSGPNFASQLNLNQDLNFGSSPANPFTPRISSLQLHKQQSSSQDENPMAIWNRATFSFTLSKTIMRPTHRGASLKTGSQSQYLQRMHKNKIEKLSRLKDEEKNKVKSKRAQLEALKTELEMIRLIGGTTSETIDNGTNQTVPSGQQIESPRSEDQSLKVSSNLMQKIQLELLRSDLENKGQLKSFAQSMTINSNLTHTGNNLRSTSMLPEGSKFLKTPALITNAPNLSQSIYQPYFLMTLDDDTIAANLNQMKSDLEKQLKEVEFNHKSEFFVYQKLDKQRIREQKELTSLTLRHRDIISEQGKFNQALENIPRIQMLNLTSKEQARNLLQERKRQLERRKYFYNEVLEKKIKQLKVESKELDELKGAIGKREKRVEEMKENLAELRQNNVEDEHKKQELIQSMLNKNLEFKVLSGLEIIVKLENALKGIERLKEKSVEEKEGMEKIKSVVKEAVNVEMLTKEDLEVMNRQKIERLRIYEQHFTRVFPDMKNIKINDEYMQKRYDDLSFSIHSLTCKYQELVVNTNYKRKLIKQYFKFQEQVERDKQFFMQFQPQKQSLNSIEEPNFENKYTKKEKTINDMRSAELQLRRSLLSQDIALKSKIIAQTCTFVNSTVGKYSYVLREIFQIMRIEQTLPGKERLGPEQLPITEYIKPAFLQLLQSYAQKFSLENLASSNQIFGATERTKGSSKTGDRKDQSPQKKKTMQKLSTSTLNRQGTLQFSLKNLAVPPSPQLQNSGQQTLRQPERRKSHFGINLTGIQKSGGNLSPLRKDSEKPETETGAASATSFDVSIMTHLKDFFTVIVVKQQHLNIFKVLAGGPVQREFSHSYSKQYILQHKLLSKLCEVCQMTKQLGVNTAIYVNGMEFKQKHPKLGLAKVEQDGQRRKPYVGSQDTTKVQNAGDLYEEDTEKFVPEEDYVNPHSKHIVYDLLVSDRRREEAEQRRLKRDSEREKALAKMTEQQRRDQTLKRLQKQVNAIKAYEKDEHSFREQFKINAMQVFNGDIPPNRETNKYILLEGQSMAHITAKTLKNQQDPFLHKHFTFNIPPEKVGLTSQASLEREDHNDIHKRLFLSPNDRMRTLELKSRQKKGQQPYQLSARIQNNNTAHHDDEFAGGNFLTTQDSFKINTVARDGGAPTQMANIQKRQQLHSQKLIQKNLQRRTVVRIDKPEPKHSNVVLQMLQDKFPELEKLFMDTAQRRAHKKLQLFQVRSGSLLSEGNSPPVKNFASPGLGSSPGDDDTTQVAGTVEGYNSDDQLTSRGGQHIGGFGTQQTIEDENSEYGAKQGNPLIKVKPVYPRGVFQ